MNICFRSSEIQRMSRESGGQVNPADLQRALESQVVLVIISLSLRSTHLTSSWPQNLRLFSLSSLFFSIEQNVDSTLEGRILIYNLKVWSSMFTKSRSLENSSEYFQKFSEMRRTQPTTRAKNLFNFPCPFAERLHFKKTNPF